METGDGVAELVWRFKIFRPDILFNQLAFENVVRCFIAIQLVWNVVNMLCEFDCQTKSCECDFLDLPHFYSHLPLFSKIIAGIVNGICFFFSLSFSYEFFYYSFHSSTCVTLSGCMLFNDKSFFDFFFLHTATFESCTNLILYMGFNNSIHLELLFLYRCYCIFIRL